MSRHHREGWTSTDLRYWKPRIEAQLPLPCVDCGRPIYPGCKDTWQVGHRIPKALGGTNTAENLGPSHRKGLRQKACNQIAGGKLGAQIQGKNLGIDRRLPNV